MALHTQLPIYKAAYGLLDVVTDLVKNMARDFKRSIGEKINAECIEILVLVFRANVAKTILQPVDRGIDFVGQLIRPWVRTPRPRTVEQAAKRLRQMPADEVYAATNSYLGLVRQATGGHADQARIANIARRRGHSVKSDLTKIYRKKEPAC